jgi:hypothetical protein
VLNPPSKKNLATSTRYYPQYHLLKIVVQAASLLPHSEMEVSNYPFLLKTHPGHNMVLFFTLRTLVKSPYFLPLWPGSFPVLP